MTPPLTRRFPLIPAELAARRDEHTAAMALVLPVVISRAPPWRDGVVTDLTTTLEEATTLGLGCLALRASAALSGDQGEYLRRYKRLSIEAGLGNIDSSARRRLMYFPILAEDDTLAEIVAEQRRYDRGSTFFSVVKTAERLKNMFDHIRHIDWLPWGGQPPWEAEYWTNGEGSR